MVWVMWFVPGSMSVVAGPKLRKNDRRALGITRRRSLTTTAVGNFISLHYPRTVMVFGALFDGQKGGRLG